MEVNQPPSSVRPDPEVQAGRALRRLRLSQGWSQEEVARRMQAYGYDFHQTTVAKIEAAQRPLRVRELAHFALLYKVEVHELIYPLNGSLDEIDREITEIKERYGAVRDQELAATAHLAAAQAEMEAARSSHMVLTREAAMLAARLDYLRQEREKFASWEDDEEPAPSDTPG